VLWNLLTISGLGYGFEFAPDRDVVIVEKINGVKIEFTLQEMMCNDMVKFKEMAQRALSDAGKEGKPEPVKRQRVIRKAAR